MRHFILLTAAMAALSLGCTSCEKIGDQPGNNPYKALELSTKSAEFARQGNDFAFHYLDRINASTTDDYVVSPLSMQFLLGMLLEGANGQTADEICSVLGYGAGEKEAVNEYCLSMLLQLPGLDKKTKLSIADAIVVNRKFSILDSYKETVGHYYQAEVSNLDFNDTAGTLKKINKWCSDHTQGMIPKVLKQVNPGAVVYLLNALYFKSEWSQKFPKGNTAREPFTMDSGAKSQVPMMKIEDDFYYQDNDLFRAVSLPYGNGAFSMTVILPVEGKTLSDVTAQLDGKAWADFAASMVRCDVDLWLPKFETRFHVDLNDILSAMGMPAAFNPLLADFSSLAHGALCLSFVQQDAVIKVDEEGTEAAAVSVAGMTLAAGPGQYIVFHADRPFLYLISEKSSGAVLFAGRYSGK